MKKILYIILFIIFFLILTILIVSKLTPTEINNYNIVGKEQSEYLRNNENIENDKNEISENKVEKIEDIKKEINSSADTEIYQIEEEKEGREILQIKPSVQFEVDLAGIIKNDKPEENELKELIKNIPKESGIWISQQSRNSFLQLLKKNNMEVFSIGDDGYLKCDKEIDNDIAKRLKKMIESKKLYIVNIKGISYQRDYISGEIVDYPFEDMDPEQIIEPYEENNILILEVTSNKKGRLKDKEILEAIIEI